MASPPIGESTGRHSRQRVHVRRVSPMGDEVMGGVAWTQARQNEKMQ
jgi:hypothetical protein